MTNVWLSIIAFELAIIIGALIRMMRMDKPTVYKKDIAKKIAHYENRYN